MNLSLLILFLVYFSTFYYQFKDAKDVQDANFVFRFAYDFVFHLIPIFFSQIHLLLV